MATVPWPQGCGTARGDQGDGLTRGPDYVRTPASFAYLAKELAGRGFAVVVPDVNSKERIDWGGEPDARKLQTNLATLHLDLLRRLDTGDSLGLSWGKELTGRLDTGRVGLVGHSSGAGWALAAGLGGDIPGTKAVAAIEPSVRDLTPTGTPPPMLSLLGQCDEQIPLEENRKEMRAVATAAPKTSFLAVILEHATHIGMLTGGGSHEIGLVQPDSSPACAKGALLAPQVQRAAAAPRGRLHAAGFRGVDELPTARGHGVDGDRRGRLERHGDDAARSDCAAGGRSGRRDLHALDDDNPPAEACRPDAVPGGRRLGVSDAA